MKTTVNKPCEIEITAVRVILNVRYGEEDIPNDFPMREGDTWRAVINIDSGAIEGWPQGRPGSMYMKVCDEGSYYLLAPDGGIVAEIESNYVPHGVIPGEYGDYVNLEIDESGVITNWPKKPDVSAFFRSEED